MHVGSVLLTGPSVRTAETIQPPVKNEPFDLPRHRNELDGFLGSLYYHNPRVIFHQTSDSSTANSGSNYLEQGSICWYTWYLGLSGKLEDTQMESPRSRLWNGGGKSPETWSAYSLPQLIFLYEYLCQAKMAQKKKSPVRRLGHAKHRLNSSPSSTNSSRA